MAANIIESSVRGVRFTISLPERIIRSLTALLGGVLKESSDFLIPDALKESTSYRIFIGNLLRYGVENIGRVHGKFDEEGKMDDDYGVKKVVGNGIELVGVVAVSASPLWVLAFLSDALWGVDKYFQRIIAELDEGEHEEERDRFQKRDDILQAMVKVSDSMAKNIDTPPLTLSEMKENFDELREYFREVGEKSKVTIDDIDDMWQKLENAAKDSDASITEISGAVTIHMMNRVRSMQKTMKASGKVTNDIIHEDILDHYKSALDDFSERGYATVVKEEFTPYLKRSWEMFSPDEKMLTERILSTEVLDYFGDWNEKRVEKSKERKQKKEEKKEEKKQQKEEKKEEKKQQKEEKKQRKVEEKKEKAEEKQKAKELRKKERMSGEKGGESEGNHTEDNEGVDISV